MSAIYTVTLLQSIYTASSDKRTLICGGVICSIRKTFKALRMVDSAPPEKPFCSKSVIICKELVTIGIQLKTSDYLLRLGMCYNSYRLEKYQIKNKSYFTNNENFIKGKQSSL